VKTTAEYLDAVKSALNLPSDYALAKYWGVSKQDISEYRAGKRTLGEDRAIAVAAILGIDPAEPLIASHAERAKSDQAREVWTALFDKISEKISVPFNLLLLGASPRRASFLTR
jgi:transcriptional regulator with XRE-family HTH domain